MYREFSSKAFVDMNYLPHECLGIISGLQQASYRFLETNFKDFSKTFKSQILFFSRIKQKKQKNLLLQEQNTNALLQKQKEQGMDSKDKPGKVIFFKLFHEKQQDGSGAHLLALYSSPTISIFRT